MTRKSRTRAGTGARPLDLSTRRLNALRARAEFEAGGDASELGQGLLASWRRSCRSVPTDLRAAPEDSARAALAEWRDSRWAAASREALAHLIGIADSHDLVAGLFDRRGRLVWQHAAARLRRQAEQVNFVPGGCWDEHSTGTNAPALALRGRPVEVFATEHYWARLSDWACWAVPVIDPASRQVIGALDLSCHWRTASPFVMALAETITKRIEDRLDGASTGNRLCLLGRGAVRVGSQLIHLPPRQLEILLALSRAPDGLTLEQLYVEVYEDDDVHPSSLKAEASRLRAALDGHLGSRPYRLEGEWTSDVGDLLGLVAAGDLAGALDLYAAPVLFWSNAPVACRLRALIRDSLGERVLNSPDPALRLRYLLVHPEESDTD
jgi:hypothetical protein